MWSKNGWEGPVSRVSEKDSHTWLKMYLGSQGGRERIKEREGSRREKASVQKYKSLNVFLFFTFRLLFKIVVI